MVIKPPTIEKGNLETAFESDVATAAAAQKSVGLIRILNRAGLQVRTT